MIVQIELTRGDAVVALAYWRERGYPLTSRAICKKKIKQYFAAFSFAYKDVHATRVAIYLPEANRLYDKYFNQ